MTTRGKWLCNRLQNKLTLKTKASAEASDLTRRPFHVIVKVIEGKKLVGRASSYVVVTLDKVKYRSRVRHSTRVPCYRETFHFDLHTTPSELKRKCVWLTVMDVSCGSPRVLGEARVDLSHVWEHPRHFINHKWVQLTLCSGGKTEVVGYLKLDIYITRCPEVLSNEIGTCQEEVELSNTFFSGEPEQHQPACFQVTVYRAYNIPCNSSCRPDTKSSPPTTSVRVSFAGLQCETFQQLRTNNPMYIERVTIVEEFPNECEEIQLEVVTADGSKVLASTQLKLSQISHGGENGFLPTFGPSLLHMYGPWHSDSSDEGPFHRGSLLVSMKTIVPFYKHPPKSVFVEPVNPYLLDEEWIVENFVLYMALFEVSMLDTCVTGKTCGVAITTGEVPLSKEERKLHYTGGMVVSYNNPVLGNLEMEPYPILQLASRQPDFRFRMFRNNMIYGIAEELELDLSHVASRHEKNDYRDPKELVDLIESYCEVAAANIQKFLEAVSSGCSEDLQKYNTELDLRILTLQKEKMEKLYDRLTTRKYNPCPSISRSLTCLNEYDPKKILKIMLAEVKVIIQELKDLLFKAPDGWPRITVWLLSGGSRVAHASIAPSDVIHSVVPEQTGTKSGQIQTVYLKPIKCARHHPVECYCISGKVELLAWMGTFRQRGAFNCCLPEGYLITEPNVDVRCKPMCLECCANIYRAKLTNARDIAPCLSPFVRINFMNHVKDTQIRQNTALPIWGEMLRITFAANVSHGRLKGSPPEMLVEIYHCDNLQRIDHVIGMGILVSAASDNSPDLLGRVTITPTFINDMDVKMPAMEWLDIRLGTERTGRIQMSAQLMQINESVKKKAYISSRMELERGPNRQLAQTAFTGEAPEPLPLSILPACRTYKMDVYFWGLREVNIANKPLVAIELEDVTMKSHIIPDCKSNCNFPSPKTSQTFKADLSSGCSPVVFNLFDTTTFGRTLFAGANQKKSQKYMFGWLPKEEREESLFSKPVFSNWFTQVNRMTYVKKKKSCPSLASFEALKNNFEMPKKELFYTEKDRSKIIRFCEKYLSTMYVKKACEEEITLLPMYTKERDNVIINETEDDWWAKYYSSLNDRSSGEKGFTGNHIMIYDSELEMQPGFCKFKEWCSTIKFYNGDKTGIPEQDENLCCGFMKACIAIYEWPPPQDTIAITSSGCNLERGYYRRGLTHFFIYCFRVIYFSCYPDNDLARYLVRVYVVKCTGLVPAGTSGASKCYVAVQTDSKRLGDREAAVPRDQQPVFGEMYEFQCILPDDYHLKVSVLDCGHLTDELIGCTHIDLEDRAYTKYRATVGLAAEYNTHGSNKWRDCERPSTILEQLCEKNHMPAPEFPDYSTVVFNGVEYKDNDGLYVPGKKYTSPLLIKENLCLHILHTWDTLPVCGHKLVPEHVETRSLYDPEKPGVEQGKIHMWVDMFPLSSRGVPAPVAIRPRPDQLYELRVIVWAVRQETNSSSGLLVRTWIGPSDEAQDTEVAMTLNGEAVFNWRMIFQFQYKHTEKKLVFQDKSSFTSTELFPPVLILQVMDVNAPSFEDFIGTLTLDLTGMPRGARTAQSACDVSRTRKINMFAVRNARGWWPLHMFDQNTGHHFSTGLIELELSLVPKEKVQQVLMASGPTGIHRLGFNMTHPSAIQYDPVPNRRPGVSSKSEACGPDCQDCQVKGAPFLIASGLLLLALCVWWQLPVLVFSVLPKGPTNMF